MKTDPNYGPSNILHNFPFPDISNHLGVLEEIGERYHEHRHALMRQLWLGLTPIYNLFHSPDLTPALVAKVSKQPEDIAEAGYQGLLELRRLHVTLDEAVRDAYGWGEVGNREESLSPYLPLDHNFYEVETLPENDRVRYTISPEARKEVLRRLLALNHQRAAEETAAKSSPSQKKLNFSNTQDKQVTSAEKVPVSTPPTLELRPQPAPKPKPKSSTTQKKLDFAPSLIVEFTPPQGGFAQRLKRVNAIGQPQNQLELTELIAALGDENGQIRWLAGASLVKVGGLAVVNLLGTYLRTNPGEVARGEALRVLGMIGEMSEDEVINSEVQKLLRR